MALLSHLHVWGAAWKLSSEGEADDLQGPASTTQAVLQLLARVTKSHDIAMQVWTHLQLCSMLTLHLPSCRCELLVSTQ